MKKLNKEILKEMLKRNGLTLTSFSNDIGISRDTLNNWMHRGVNIPAWKCEIIEEYFLDKYKDNDENLFI